MAATIELSWCFKIKKQIAENNINKSNEEPFFGYHEVFKYVGCNQILVYHKALLGVN